MDRRFRSVVAVSAISLILGGGVVRRGNSQTPQFPSRPQPNYPQPRGMDPVDPTRDPLAAKVEEQQAKSRNTDRQKRLVADTDKLLGLATELKQQVDKTDKNTMSVDVIKKAEEIEKLAHSVKERMKGGV